MSRLLRTVLVLLAVGVMLAAGAVSVDAYMSIRVPNGSPGQALPVRWDLNNISARPNIANRRVLYEIGDSGCADAAGFQGPINEFEAIQNSFSNWRNVNESEIDFEFTGATTNEVSSASDNRNVVRWVNSNIASGVFAVTITTFDTSSGQITDTDMELNDRDFTWDTLGPGGTSGVLGRAMIENVVTHEIGHVLGLDHPNNAQATMFFASGAGLISQTTLEADDVAPLIADYTNMGVVNADFGTVQGSVSDGSGAKFGVYVTLIDVSTGANVVGSASEGTPGPFTLGSYEIVNVPPGNYLAFACPVRKSALGSYYGTAFTSFYPIVNGVAVGTIGTPTLVKVAPGATVSGVNLTLPGASQNPFEPDNGSGSASALDDGEIAVASVSPAADEDWYSFTTTQTNQQVTVRVLSDAFGFDLNPTLTLFDTNGSSVLATPEFGQPGYLPSANDIDEAAFDLSGVNYDAEIVRVMPSPGTYFFKVASRAAATTGTYVVTLELSDIDVNPDTVASTIESGVPGIAANSGGNFTITVTPKNLFGRDLNSPNSFDVQLLDVTGTPTVLQTITSGTAPFDFTVNALSTAQVIKYSATIDGTQIGSEISVSHYGTLSTTNSRIVLLESTLNANGYDRIPVMIQLRDGANNPLPNSSIPVTVTTSAGTLDNGSTTGASNVAATFDSATGNWFIELIAPTNTGTATLTAFANSTQIDSKQVTILARASGTGGGPGTTSGGGEDDDDDGGGCVVNPGGALAVLILLLLAGLGVWRRQKTSQ